MLTPEELSLLRPDELDEADGSNAGDEATAHAAADSPDWAADWQDPGSVRAQLEVLESFHQEVADRFADALSRSLQRMVEVHLVQVQSMAYSQFAHSRVNPTCYMVLTVPQLPTPLSLDLRPETLYPLLDCLLGGGNQACELPERPPTELEQRLARGLVATLMDELHDAWEPLLAVDLSIDRVESQSQRVRVVAPGELIATLTFRVDVADQSGEMTFCLPIRAIRKIVDKLLVGEYHHGNEGGSRASGGSGEDAADLIVQFEANAITPDKLAALQVGDVILSNVDVDGAVQLTLNGEQVGRGQLGAIQGQRAVIVSE